VALDLSREEISALQRANWLKFHSLGAARDSSPIFNLRLYYFKLRPLVKSINPDVYFAPYFERGVPSDVCPVVIAVHDAIPLATGQYSQKGFFHNLLKGIFYRHMWKKQKDAAVIICSSKTTQQEVSSIGKLPAEKTRVIHLGISEQFQPSNEYPPDMVQEVFGSLGMPANAKYVLHDAGLEPNKNAHAALELFAELDEEIYLCVTGGDFVYEDGKVTPVNERAEKFWSYAKQLGVADRVIPAGRISEDGLVVLFRFALLYLNLSGYEGFGFGPGQAMWSKIPAVISKNPCFEEIYGEHALVVDFENPEAAAQKVSEFLQDVARRRTLIEDAYTYVQKYTWQETFSKTWALITNI
jgi:glycosyltransferase involved in cell wall biosynthesis